MESELWVISGEAPGHWEIPVAADQRQGLRRLTPACALLSCQRMAFDLYLGAVGVALGGEWGVSEAWLKVYGRRELGAKADDLLVWHAAAKVEVQYPKEGRNGEGRDEPDLTEFISAAAAAAPGLSRAQVESMWHVFCTVALKWLLGRRFVDLGFARLHLSPFRVDWKEKVSQHNRAAIASGTAFRSILLTQLRGNGNRGATYFDTSIDLEYRFKWWAQVKRHELEKAKRSGGAEYLREFMDFVSGREDLSRHLYRAWEEEVSRPGTRAIKGDGSGGTRLVAGRRVAGFRDARAYCDEHASIVERLRAQGGPKALAAANGGVPAVPGVQSEIEDVRDIGPDVPSG